MAIRFDEADGMALFKLAESGLKFVIANAQELPPEQLADLCKLSTFISQYGASCLYELATF